ncbi:MAG: hypothetical protein Q9165_002103 [Trypethelium subeluteriae]
MLSARGNGARHDVTSSAPPRTAHAYPNYVHPDVLDAQANDLFWILVALRIANALTVGTFFQPDEYYQSLEPAWATVFGRESGAWITWEWLNQLRSSLHPLLFAIPYYISSVLSFVIDLSPPLRAELLVAAPKVVQGLLAASTDFYTWKLGEKLYGRSSSVAWAALSLAVLNPWQWFFSTRTFSNNLETTLTIVAIYLWPWHWSSDKLETDVTDQNGLRTGQEKDGKDRPLDELTNSIIVVLEGLVDRWFYGAWGFPPIRFVYYNIAQNIAVFYGTSRVDYYYTEGLPLVLTTALPFAIAGVWRSLRFRSEGLPPDLASPEAGAIKVSQGALRVFAITVCMLPMSLSLLAHKEVRFITPILPMLHILAAKPFASFYNPFPAPRIGWRKLLLFGTVFVNLLIAGYAGYVHQRGVIDVTRVLRREHQQVLYDLAVAGEANTTGLHNMSVGFLMPCHSTPWRSHLVHPTIEAWALTCEPPLDIPLSQRHLYADEADQFYEDPKRWLDIHMAPLDTAYDNFDKLPTGQAHRRNWPDYLVFFEQLEPTMQSIDVARHYSEYWRGFNTHWHDDWRRQGDVIAWRRGKGKGA